MFWFCCCCCFGRCVGFAYSKNMFWMLIEVLCCLYSLGWFPTSNAFANMVAGKKKSMLASWWGMKFYNVYCNIQQQHATTPKPATLTVCLGFIAVDGAGTVCCLGLLYFLWLKCLKFRLTWCDCMLSWAQRIVIQIVFPIESSSHVGCCWTLQQHSRVYDWLPCESLRAVTIHSAYVASPAMLTAYFGQDNPGCKPWNTDGHLAHDIFHWKLMGYERRRLESRCSSSSHSFWWVPCDLQPRGISRVPWCSIRRQSRSITSHHEWLTAPVYGQGCGKHQSFAPADCHESTVLSPCAFIDVGQGQEIEQK